MYKNIGNFTAGIRIFEVCRNDKTGKVIYRCSALGAEYNSELDAFIAALNDAKDSTSAGDMRYTFTRKVRGEYCWLRYNDGEELKLYQYDRPAHMSEQEKELWDAAVMELHNFTSVEVMK